MATTAETAEQMALDLIDGARTEDVLGGDELRRRLKIAYSLMTPDGISRIRARLLKQRSEITSGRESSALRAVLDSLDKPAWVIRT